MMSMQRADHERGAVLLILLTVVALGAASLFIGAAGNSGRRAAQEHKSIVAIEQAREALLGFALAHGRLPRPAASALDGSESATACSTEASCTGFIPWTALGIGRSDGWGKLLRYSVTPVYTSAPVMRTSVVGTKTVLTRDSAGTISYIAGFPVCAPGTPCLVAVIYSAGRDNFGTSEQGIVQPNAASGNTDEAANNIATANFMSRAASTNPHAPGGEFDDLVAYISPELLYRQMERAKVLP
jgi:type II secretory pathway pseudopilin PulG